MLILKITINNQTITMLSCFHYQQIIKLKTQNKNEQVNNCRNLSTSSMTWKARVQSTWKNVRNRTDRQHKLKWIIQTHLTVKCQWNREYTIELSIKPKTLSSVYSARCGVMDYALFSNCWSIFAPKVGVYWLIDFDKCIYIN